MTFHILIRHNPTFAYIYVKQIYSYAFSIYRPYPFNPITENNNKNNHSPFILHGINKFPYSSIESFVYACTVPKSQRARSSKYVKMILKWKS